MKVKEIIEEAKKNTSTRKTKNSELYNSIIVALCHDKDYIAKNVTSATKFNVVTEDLSLSDGFKKIIIKTLKKHTNLSEAEATDIADKFKLSSEDAKTLASIVHEADYIAMKDCKKKGQLIKKPGLDISMTIVEVPERVRPNPRDPEKKVKTIAHDRVKIQQTLFDYQKSIISK